MIEIKVDGHTLFEMATPKDIGHLRQQIVDLKSAAKSLQEVSNQYLTDIANLRDEWQMQLAERDAEIERLKKSDAAWVAANCGTGWINELRDHAKMYLVQRKVLAQALEALQELNQSDGKDRTAGQLSEAVLQAEAAITAIQEVL